MGRTTKRFGAAIAMTAAIGLATATTAAAHECYNASRSDKGNTQAGANSNAWFTLVVADAIGGDVADGVLTPEQGECVLAAYEASGAPSSFTIKTVAGKDGVVGGPNNADGHGIDHVFAAYGDVIGGAYAGCGAGGPG
ncbi:MULTISPECIES: hypothetical protein [unclassified Knoellia]|uniref:hypothetical protein n=1 Tax=Knoellia altitudinis TaxID=3404795 RepID=UPI00361D0D77